VLWSPVSHPFGARVRSEWAKYGYTADEQWRLDFFETALAFLAGYGNRAFLITQSLNQIEKAFCATSKTGASQSA
jgi:hypothetical protein